MFEVLLASGAHADLKAPWLTTSVVTHALVIALAVVATRAALDAPRVALPVRQLTRQSVRFVAAH